MAFMASVDSLVSNSEKDNQSALSEELLILHLVATGIVRRFTTIERGQMVNGTYEIPLQLGLDRLNIWRYRRGLCLFRSVPDLLAHCQEPISLLLLGEKTIFDEDMPLLNGPFPSELCQDLACMTGDVEADLSESQFILRVFDLCKDSSAPQAYTDFRRLLIEAPVMTSLALLQCYNRYPSLFILRDLLEEAYEPASFDYMVNGTFYCCPICKNLQLFDYEKKRWDCENERCRRQSVQVGPGVKMVATEQIHCLKRGLRRFVTLPGLTELRLEKSLLELGPEVNVEMWPAFDSYDLLVHLPGKKLAIDVKDWSNPYLLARKVQEKGIPLVPEWDEAYYVFPQERKHDQPDYVRAFIHTCNTLNGKIKISGKVQAAFEDDFIWKVTQMLRGSR